MSTGPDMNLLNARLDIIHLCSSLCIACTSTSFFFFFPTDACMDLSCNDMCKKNTVRLRCIFST